MEQALVDVCGGNVCRSSDLLLAFVNSGPHGSGRTELLGDTEALGAWMTGAGLMGDSERVTGADAVAGRELRDALATVFRAHSDCPDGAMLLPDAEEYLRWTAERYPLTLRITAEGCDLAPSQTGILGAFGALFAAAADLASRGIWARMKVCKNPTCHSGFFDKTRNSSGLYCGSACSSQAAQRAYRSRLKSERAS
ncbi:CGNR zinc finger domain-containing protein [Streptomyces sp. NBC_01716]|uniref:CGNR zinc finger domain-containing protein n=1 Tax=Streptomyces sp. NBC_01716 TaxID=2975917 RepID=UPI002E336573|nr:CGNR zinc finger domain-containing protein [Streptomyces sp. NBC_01716]